ncbi:hypothetical protein E2C01_079568 [Portunus trituberculatus]|uniref:Uncharacterized protein n=1 Tax=Portunus trituberculatus TaxID=210409 RepID=A0A5B7IVZ2_PORTR|nr:hypothetical protein [Portunus trituberculatus]
MTCWVSDGGMLISTMNSPLNERLRPLMGGCGRSVFEGYWQGRPQPLSPGHQGIGAPHGRTTFVPCQCDGKHW